MPNVPNLDALEPAELMEFWYRHQCGRGYRKIFPTGGRGAQRATGDLAAYAANKATAMRCRLSGDIPTAQIYENIADSIFEELPAFARW